MALRQIKDLMLPLDEYAVVPEDATMLDAIYALDNMNANLPAGLQPHRAVLVANKGGEIIGKLGHLAFLRGLEPKYRKMGDLGMLSRVGLSSDFISSMMDNMNLWKERFSEYARRAKKTRVKDVMHSVTESIDVEAPLSEAVHKIVMYQTLSLLVTKEKKIVGILRLSDLYAEICDGIKNYISTHGEKV